MKSSGPVFTRQNPFPPASTAKRGHYHLSRKQSLSKKEKQITLSPVRLHPSRREKSDISASDGQHVFTEIWPSGECESSPDSNADSPQISPDKLSVRLEPSTGPPGVKEDSVLAKYVERFRHGRPQSREERQQMASTDGEEQMPFWWTAHSSGPSLTRTKSLEKGILPVDGSDPTAYSPAGQPQRDRSFNVVSDSSQGEFDETEILHLQERASKLLLRGECSPSDGDFPVSSDGLGCSDFSSPVSVDEPVRQPLIPSVLKPTAVRVIPEWARAAPFQKSVIPTMTPPTRPEDDILFQWRLRRKMEQARGWSQSMKQSGLQDSAFSWQAPSLVHQSAGGQPYKNSQPRQFSERDAYAHGTVPRAEITEAHRLSPPLLPAAVVPSSSMTSQTQALSHVPAHMHLLCDVLPCPGQSSRATGEQTFSQMVSEPQTKVVHKKTQVSESLSGTNSDGLIKECRPPSPPASSGNIIEEGPSQQKVPDKKKKKKLVTKESDQKTGLPSRQQRKPARDCSNPSLPKNTTASKEQHQQDGSEDVPDDRCVGRHVPPSSPLHMALGQVVSEVLFPTAAQETPVSSASPPEIISSPSQSPVPLYVTPNSLEVISRLIQEAEDSDGEEFEDDALLQVLRHQRKWVKDQIREVDVMLNELEEQPVA
ncbi:proline and serine-rich protein 3 isoform X2 [Fundulus heteroclitus]|uniref:proline and serine-rich protein 3 isoform X2 n=1 Tax=Fundulus heteroclitus TaxID=8078 RepID=UPI00165C9EB7|nr:proline and serine-rich protein 3 isoform X2 [Fundulus heteroclitus]